MPRQVLENGRYRDMTPEEDAAFTAWQEKLHAYNLAQWSRMKPLYQPLLDALIAKRVLTADDLK